MNVTHTSVLLVGLAITTLVLFFCFFDEEDAICEADPDICPCLKLLPSDDKFGISYEIGRSPQLLSKVVFSGDKNISSGLSPELAEKFVDCVVKLRDTVEFINYAHIVTSPIGQVADEWLGETGLKISLRPRDEREIAILNNLQIGPISGLKWHILEKWCSREVMGRCVTCSSLESGADAIAVEVKLRDNAPVSRDYWSDNWLTDRPRMPWDDIDENGIRYLYSCAS